MEIKDQKRFSTFLLASGQRLKIEAQGNADWNLIMLNFISGQKPISIINSSLSDPEARVKNALITFNEGEPDCRIMNFRLSKKEPFICFLNKKRSYIQFVFASNSKEKLMVEQLNQEFISVGESINPNFPNIFMNEIQRIVKSEHPLELMSSFIKKYEIRPYFHVHSANFEKVLSDSINFSLIKMSEKAISAEISHYINFLDLQFFLGGELLLHDAIIIEKIIRLFPQLKGKINHAIIHTKNFFVFACFLMEKELFDFSLLHQHFNLPEKIDIVISFKILKIIIDEKVPFSSSLLKMFLPYVQPPLLQMLLSSNKILYDSTVIPKQISNIVLPPSFKARLHIDNVVNFGINLAESDTKTPEKTVPDKNVTTTNVPAKKVTAKSVVSFRPQKLNEVKKPNLSIKPEWSYEISQDKPRQLNIVQHDCIFLEKSIDKDRQTISISPNTVEDDNKLKIQSEKSSKQNSETIIIAFCASIALITILFIWTHFSFYVL